MSHFLPMFHEGKVRDTHLVQNMQLRLMRARDRLSTHNVVHKTEVPQKGELLTALTLFWMMEVLPLTPNHLVAWGKKIYDFLPKNHECPPRLHYDSLVVEYCPGVPVEFIWRNRLAGSLEKAYQEGKDPYGLGLKPGLRKMALFHKPLFTPTRKSKKDEPLKHLRVREKYPIQTCTTEELFRAMNDYLATRGVELIDAKFEVSEWKLIDEWGTSDCCRFAWAKDVKEGRDPSWLDKQVFRDEAELAWGGKRKYPLHFNDKTLKLGTQRYHEAFEAITGKTLAQFQRVYMT